MLPVLTIDPSLTNTGLAWHQLDLATLTAQVTGLELFPTKGAEAVRKSADDMRRAAELADRIRRARSGMALVFAEIPSGAQNARAAFANGAVLGALAASGPIIQVSPDEVKRASVGKRNASKAEMIEWAVAMHPEAPWLRRKLKGQLELLAANEHLADAIAVLYAGLRTDQFAQVRAMTPFVPG